MLARCAAILLAFLLVACGSSAKSDAQQATDLLNAGLKAQAEGRTSEAVDDYNKVLTHDSKNKYALYNLGVIEQQAGRNDSAESKYRAALQSDGDFVAALFNLATIRTGPAPQEAADLYRHVIAVEPNNASAHLNLGFVLQSQGHPAEATAEFAKAVSLDPTLASRIPSPSPQPNPTASPH